jgi:hypothetical protein
MGRASIAEDLATFSAVLEEYSEFLTANPDFVVPTCFRSKKVNLLLQFRQSGAASSLSHTGCIECGDGGVHRGVTF